MKSPRRSFGKMIKRGWKKRKLVRALKNANDKIG